MILPVFKGFAPAASALLLAGAALGQTERTWIGGDGRWTADPGNWDPFGLPGVNDTAIIGGNTVRLSANRTVGQIVLSDATLRTLTHDLTLNGGPGGSMSGGSAVIESGATLQIDSPARFGASVSRARSRRR